MSLILKSICVFLIVWLNVEFIYSDVSEHLLIPSSTVSGKSPHKFNLEAITKLQEAVKKLEMEMKQLKFDEHYGIKKEQGKKKLKNGKIVPIKERSVGRTSLIDYSPDYYLVNVSLGTPPQWFLLQPTQFSADLWVIDAECESLSCVGSSATYNRRLFYKNQSSTFYSTEDDVFLYVYDANVAQDRLQLGGLSTYQSFALAFDVDSFLDSAEFDGMLGLCDTVATNLEGTSSPLQNLRRSMDNAVYTVWLNGQQSPGDINGGQLTFGGFDPTHCESDWKFTPVTNNTRFSHFWEFQISGFTVGNATKTMDNRRKRPALSLIDFPLMLAPPGNVQTIAETAGFKLNKEINLFVVDCATDLATLPDIVLKVGDARLPITPKQYIMNITVDIDSDEDDSEEAKPLNNREMVNICLLGILPYNNWGMGPAWAFGNPFLRNYCVSYGLEETGRKVGFARSRTPLDSVVNP